MNIRKSEVIRYLGYGRNPVDNKTSDMIDECLNLIDDIADYKCIYKRYSIAVRNGVVIFPDFELKSERLCFNLKDCEEAYLFLATLGAGFDMQLKRYMRFDMPRALVWQAIGAAAIEDYCNDICQKIADDLVKEGLYLRPRFSPGYGDLALCNQRLILPALDSARKAGVTLTEGDIMLPEKSVSAIIGITKKKSACYVKGCASCEKTDCEYRG
ncbi:MAG: Vitamin B12 dependent methionine synthase activation subunit [Lachnospiraceae bacterium]|nr:Vitamin B12 dependent methionine synthase activation subunit [Lachnospiraceae bacterium]